MINEENFLSASAAMIQ